MYLDRFDVLILKIIFKKLFFYFNIFLNEKHFKSSLTPQPQTQILYV